MKKITNIYSRLILFRKTRKNTIIPLEETNTEEISNSRIDAPYEANTEEDSHPRTVVPYETNTEESFHPRIVVQMYDANTEENSRPRNIVPVYEANTNENKCPRSCTRTIPINQIKKVEEFGMPQVE